MKKEKLLKVTEVEEGIKVDVKADDKTALAMFTALGLTIAKNIKVPIEDLYAMVLDVSQKVIEDKRPKSSTSQLDKELGEYVAKALSLEEAAMPVHAWLLEHSHPHAKVIIAFDGITLLEEKYGIPLDIEEDE